MSRVHPWVVHFSVALIVASVVLFMVGTTWRDRAWAGGVLNAARWNLWIGAAFALASIGTGFLDYLSAQCDQEAIAATILHRRAGALTWWASLIAGIAAWRTRQRPPGGLLQGWLVLVAATAVVAATLGTGLTYGRGLGVRGAAPPAAAPCFELERGTHRGPERAADPD